MWDGPHVSASSLLDRLTAFVLKSFSQARAYIFVEDSHIQDSRNWLSQKQKENGCFQRSGSLFNNAIKVMLFLSFRSLKTAICRSNDVPTDGSRPGDMTLSRMGDPKASKI